MESKGNEYENAEISDDYVALAHTDYLVDVAERRSRGENRVLERCHLPTLRKGGVNLICDHVGGDTRLFSTFPLKKLLSASDSLERSLHGIDCMRQEAEESNGAIRIITRFEEISDAYSLNQLGIVLCLQGGSPIREDLGLLRTLHRLGIRCIHLTANVRNAIGDSCMDHTNAGLTDFGMEVVEEMNRIGMVIDIAQLSMKGCEDVLRLSSQPVIASNSNARSLCNIPRNLEDNVIEMVGANGGVIGIHCSPQFLVPNGVASIDDMIRHIDYIVDLTSIDHVGLGPDLMEDWPEQKYSALWGSGHQLGNIKMDFSYPHGFESISDIPNLTSALVQAGYSKADVSKIMGSNLLRVFKGVWK